MDQLELFAPPRPPSPEFDWDRPDRLVILDSGGKDSGASTYEACRQADQAGQLHKVRVLHCDLGSTPGGQLIEWPGAEAVARAHAAQAGVPFAVRRSTRWPSLWDRIMAHGNFPGFFARFCTSDMKTAVGRDYVDELGRELGLDRPIRAGYALGLRGEESKARACKPVIERHRMSGKGTKREVTTWLPVKDLKTADVWRLHREHGIASHEAYEQGMRRLSCRACPLAAREDLVRSAQLNPELFAEYAAAEQAMGQPFKPSCTLAQIRAEAAERSPASA